MQSKISVENIYSQLYMSESSIVALFGCRMVIWFRGRLVCFRLPGERQLVDEW